LALEHAQQSTTGQHSSVSRQSDVMRFVAGCAGARKLHSGYYLAVASRAFIEIDDRKKIRIQSCLIPSPDKEKFFMSVITVVRRPRICERSRLRERGRRNGGIYQKACAKNQRGEPGERFQTLDS